MSLHLQASRAARTTVTVRDPGTDLPRTPDIAPVPRPRSAGGTRSYQPMPEPVSPFPIRGILDPMTPMGPEDAPAPFASAREALSSVPLATPGDTTREPAGPAPMEMPLKTSPPVPRPATPEPGSPPERETVSERVARLQPHISPPPPPGAARGPPGTPPSGRAALPGRPETGGGLIRQAAASIFARDMLSPRPRAPAAVAPQSAKDKFMSAKARFEAAAKLRFDGPSRSLGPRSGPAAMASGGAASLMYPEGSHMPTLAKVRLVQEFASPRAQHAGIANY